MPKINEYKEVSVPPDSRKSVPPHVDESKLASDEKQCSDKPECEAEEMDELQAEDPGNQGS